MPQRIKRLQLIKTMIQMRQRELMEQSTAITTQMAKKELSIKTFEQYLTEYQNKMHTQGSFDTPGFINFQLFLDQIAGVLYKEREELQLLTQKNEEINRELMKQLSQIDVLDEAISSNPKTINKAGDH